MIASRMKSEIESFATHLVCSHPLMRQAAKAAITPGLVVSYLSGVHTLVKSSQRHLDQASRRAAELGRADLSAHLREKSDSELGHERWAERDLGNMQDLFGLSSTSFHSQAIDELLAYLDAVIAEDPARYLAYTLFAEYLTVLVGPVWVQLLEERCGVPASALTVVVHHVELDKDHVAAGLREIDGLLGEAADAAPFLQTLHASMRYFERFCDELYDAHRHGEPDGAGAHAA